MSELFVYHIKISCAMGENLECSQSVARESYAIVNNALSKFKMGRIPNRPHVNLMQGHVTHLTIDISMICKSHGLTTSMKTCPNMYEHQCHFTHKTEGP